MFFSVRVIAAPNGPFKKGVLLDFGFYRTFKKLISIVSYTYTLLLSARKKKSHYIYCVTLILISINKKVSLTFNVSLTC